MLKISCETIVNNTTPLCDMNNINRCKKFKFLHLQLACLTVNDKSALNDRFVTLFKR